jgi:hypothetical protein
MNWPPIDWAPFDKFPEDTITCACGTTFRSHAKYVAGVGIKTRKPCRSCNGTRLIVRVSSDAKSMSIGPSDVEPLK